MLALCDQTFGRLIEAIGEIEKLVADPLERMRRFGEAYVALRPGASRRVPAGLHGAPTSPESIRKVGHRAPIDDPTQPGVGGAMVFTRLVAISRPSSRPRASSSTTRRTPAPNSAGWASTAWSPR